jgi:acetyl esterase/lipase
VFDTCVYGNDGVDLHVDLYRPAEEQNLRTAVLVLHGGGWRAGERSAVGPRCELLRGLGFTALAVEYRLIGEEVAWPTPLADVKRAIRWVRSEATELGVDPDRIVLQGHSAGAQLAILAAGTASEGDAAVAAVIAHYCTAGFDPSGAAVPMSVPPTLEESKRMLAAIYRPDGTVPAWMLFDHEASAEEIAAASPLTYMTAAHPPTFFLHGDSDTAVSVEASIRLHRALREAGVATDLHLYAGQQHEFDLAPTLAAATAVEIGAFIRRMLFDRDRIADETLRFNQLAALAAST